MAVIFERFAIVRQIDSKANFNWAISNGKLKYLQYLNEKGLCVGQILKRYSALTKIFSILNPIQWNECETDQFTENAVDWASAKGDLEYLEYLTFKTNVVGTESAVDLLLKLEI